jgi:hypothetical protein
MLIQLLLITAFALTTLNIWRRERGGQLSRLSAIMWSLVWLGATVVVALPETASWFAQRLGVGRGADAVTYLAVAFLYYLVFRLFLSHRKMESDFSRLIQQLALRDMGNDETKKDNDPRNDQ